MSTELSIFPHRNMERGGLQFSSTSKFDRTKNSVTLSFLSRTYSGDDHETEITPFFLNDVDAEILTTFGQLDDERRAALIPTIRALMADQEGEA